jgi:hypothetical protein
MSIELSLVAVLGNTSLNPTAIREIHYFFHKLYSIGLHGVTTAAAVYTPIIVSGDERPYIVIVN